MEFERLNQIGKGISEQKEQKNIVKKQKRIGVIAKKIDKVEKELASLYSKIEKKEKELARLKQELKELL